jgi:hypothetical protein
MENAKCIYCDNKFDPRKGDGDHIIPAALGEFRNDTRFRGLCPECNMQIGKSEQVLLHCGPEALLRRIVGPARPPTRQRGRAYVNAAMGSPGPQHTINYGDHHLLVQPCEDAPQSATPVDQLVIHDSAGVEHFFRLFPGMNPLKLKEKILSKIAPPPIPKMWLWYAPENEDEYRELIANMWSKYDYKALPDTPAGVHRVDARIRVVVNDHYWRAIAKIAFHFYLSHNRRGMRGDEPGFFGIRDFIRNGGAKGKFFRTDRPFIALPFGELPGGGVLTPRQWCHIVAADETQDEVIAYVHLFLGDGCLLQPHYISLGKIGAPFVWAPNLVHARVYMYDEAQRETGKAGTAHEPTITPLSPRL